MTCRHRLIRWGVAGLTCLVVGSALSVPEHLPRPVQFTLHKAVDHAASFWLWVMNQPRTVEDGPEWRLTPVEYPGVETADDEAKA